MYLVEHVHTGDHLALKLLLGNAAMDSGAVERFKREARASARIKSENVVKVVDADTAPELEGAPFLVMELLNGTDLQKQLEQKGRFSPADAYKYLSEAARALDKSHAMGIVHRDLKPENLFLHTREDGTMILKILDFGISKLVGSEAANDMAGVGMTNTGTVMGTPLYMSPEQARGRVSEIAATTDVWAMGLISMQLLTGEIYWRANTIAELMVQILSDPFYQPSHRWTSLPPAVDAWFAKSCARDPAQRFAKVGLQIDALGEALGLRAPAAAQSPSARGISALAATAAHDPSQANASGAYGTAPAQLAFIPGAHTTTGAVSQEGSLPRSSSRSSSTIGIALATLVAVGGGAAWIVHSKLQPHAQPPLAAAVIASTSEIAPTASAVMALPTLSGIDAGAPTAIASQAPATSVAANPPSAVHPSATHHRAPSPAAAASSTEATPSAPQPAGTKKPFTPSGL